MAVMTYVCKYTPLELMLAFGAGFEAPNNDVPDFSKSEPLIRQNLCSHAKMLVLDLLRDPDGQNTQAAPASAPQAANQTGSAGSAPSAANQTGSAGSASSAANQTGSAGSASQAAASGKRELILTNCCDSIRRVLDSVPEDRFSFRQMLDLPHTNHGYAIDLYTRQLLRLISRYSRYCGHSYDRAMLIEAWRKNAEAWQELLHENEDFIAVLGARPSDELFQKLRAELRLPLVNLTCGGLRPLPEPPADVEKLDEDGLIRAYATALLSQVPCMRMEDVSGRTRLLRLKGLRGIIYHSVKFCDYYSFEYAEIRRHSDLPILKIESDYTSQSEGQLNTRIAAFAENMETVMKKTYPEQDTKEHAGPDADGIYVGIDSGSTSTNVAAIDADGHLVASVILRTGAKAGLAAEKGLAQLKEELGDRADRIRRIISTGYGREFISFADDTKTEISCHARGAHFADPKARTIIDIGGQDSKVICLDEDGNVMNFVMNDKCAAGTGRFLEMMAHTLEISMEEMSSLGLTWKKDLTISSTCTVFAESEVVSLIAENTATSDIIHALDKSVASKTAGMVRRVQGKGPYMMTGGVARNEGVAKELEKKLGAKLAIMQYPDLIGALGAALFARG